MTSTQHGDKPTLIVGLGATGLSCARFFERTGEPFAFADSRTAPPGLAAARRRWPDADVYLGPLDENQLRRAQRVIVSPGVSLRDPAILAARTGGAECIGDIELFARTVSAPVVAITGSNGKSTVTAMTAEMLEAAGHVVQAGGNYSPPALDLLADSEADPDFYVLELSSFQLESTYTLRPIAAVVLNISADHMDRYDSLAEYAAAKGRIYSGARIAVVNRDDPGAERLAGTTTPSIGFTLGTPNGEDFGILAHEGEAWVAHGTRAIMPVRDLGLPGAQNRANALAALALACAAGADVDRAANALRTFRGLPHRMELVAEAAGVRWFNDSKATNPGAAAAAIAGMDCPVVLIAGGDGKEADFSALREPLRQHARAVILIGRDAGRIADVVSDVVPVEYAASLEAAVDQAAARAEPGDCVLLSPACASFDMFRDYQARGDEFAAAVRRRCT